MKRLTLLLICSVVMTSMVIEGQSPKAEPDTILQKTQTVRDTAKSVNDKWSEIEKKTKERKK